MHKVTLCLTFFEFLYCHKLYQNRDSNSIKNKSYFCCQKRFPEEAYHYNEENISQRFFKIFVKKTYNAFRNELRNTDYTLFKNILLDIWRIIGYNDTNKLALFVSSSLHNTSFYKIFEANEDDMYRSRGLLMIKGVNNYKLLTYLSLLKSNDYVRNPELLSIPDFYSIYDTIEFWEVKLKNNYTFENMMISLHIQSWIDNKSNQDIINWRNMYKKLRCVYRGK